jgi:hypothetical protein
MLAEWRFTMGMQCLVQIPARRRIRLRMLFRGGEKQILRHIESGHVDEGCAIGYGENQHTLKLRLADEGIVHSAVAEDFLWYLAYCVPTSRFISPL